MPCCNAGVAYDDFEGGYFPCPECSPDPDLRVPNRVQARFDDFEGNVFAGVQ